MRMLEIFLLTLALVASQLVRGDELEDGGTILEAEEGGLPQPKLMSSMLPGNFDPMSLLGPRPGNDFTNFFTQDPSGGYNDDGAKSDLSNSLEDYSAPHAPPLLEYPVGYQGPSGYEANSNSYGSPSNSYESPSDGYGAPSNSYGVPSNSYGAPSDGYGAASNSYDQPSSYDVPLTDQSLTPQAGSYNSPSPGSYGRSLQIFD